MEMSDRRRRINRLKRMIITVVLLAILFPTVLCFVMGAYLYQAKSDYKRLEEQYNQLVEQLKQSDESSLGLEITPEKLLVSEQIAESEEEEAPEESLRRVYLTFDDGPSSNTDRILDILDAYQVKATFFVVGKEDEIYAPMYQRIVEDGHTLGMHSYSHNYQEIYQSVDAFSADLTKLQNFLYERTGVLSHYYRFPGGSSNHVSKIGLREFADYLAQQDIVYYDWNISSGDAQSTYISTEDVLKNCLNQLHKYQNAILLFHDASGKDSTVEALPQLIEGIQSLENTVILPITDSTELIQHIKYESEDE